jgi:broad-specificity NMP kinase
MGFVVELCGLPGSGKSTLARALVARLRLAGEPAVEVMAPLGPSAGRTERMARKVAMVSRAAVRPEAWRLAVDVGLRSGQRSARDRVARPVNLLVVREALARAARRPGVHVLDQGPLQEWWSAALRADADRVLAWAAADGPTHADLVVRLDAPTDALVRRLAARSGAQSRVEELDAAALRSELDRGAGLLDALIDDLVRSPRSRPPHILRVDSGDPSAVDVVREAIAGSQ